MALVFPSLVKKPSEQPLVRPKEDVLSLIVKKRSHRSILPEEASETLTTSVIPKNFRRFKALVTGAPPAKQKSRFCKCGCELDLDLSALAVTPLRISTIPGEIAPESLGEDGCIHLPPKLKMTGQYVAPKPKERRGTFPALVARQDARVYDW